MADTTDWMRVASAPANHEPSIYFCTARCRLLGNILFFGSTRTAAFSVIFIRFKLQLSQNDSVVAYVLQMATQQLSKPTLRPSRQAAGVELGSGTATCLTSVRKL